MSGLAGATVVVTRPAHQAEHLCLSIEQQGGSALRFPVIEIGPPANRSALNAQLQHLDTYQLAIFVSSNAVSAAIDILNARQGWPQIVAIAAVGRATEKSLITRGLTVAHCSPEPFNSEALLSLAELQTVRGQRVMIFRGNGGRELLANTLRERGAEVEYAECYQRITPNTDTADLYRLWDEGCSMPIVVTSHQSLKNLYTMVDDAHRAALLSSPLIVVSQRIGAAAKTLGFYNEPQVTQAASDEAILDAINKWANV